MLLHFCHWLNATSLGDAVRASKWAFPIVEIFHVLGLSVLGGAILIVNLRLFGLRNQPEPAEELWRDVQPLMIGGLLVALISGFLLFASEAGRMYYNHPFRYKMVFLILAIAFTFTVQRRVALSEKVSSALSRKLVVVASILLWSGVGIGGRLIGYLQ